MINLQKPVDVEVLDITSTFTGMLKTCLQSNSSPTIVRFVKEPVFVIETADNKRYALEMRSVVCSDLHYAAKELASYHVDIIFIKEVIEENIDCARRYKIRFQLIKYVGHPNETDH